MAIDIIAERIAALEAFGGLPEATLERITRAADRMVFREGQALVEAGRDCDGAIVIVGGTAAVQADPTRDIAAQALETGSMIGEVGMLAIMPLRRTSSRDLWQLTMLEKSEKAG